jgi:hypothetical protein
VHQTPITFLCLCDRCGHDRSQARAGANRDIVARRNFIAAQRNRETEFLVGMNFRLRGA